MKSLQAKFRARTEEKKEPLRKYQTKICKEHRPVAGLVNAYRNDLQKFLFFYYLISESSVDNHERLKEMQVNFINYYFFNFYPMNFARV